MSQARAMSFQTMKSLNYLYKVFIGANTSLSYCSDSSCSALSFVKKFSTLNSAATNEYSDLQNPDQFSGIGKNSSGYGKDWSSRESDSEYDQNPNGSSRESDSEYDHNPYWSSTESESEYDVPYDDMRFLRSLTGYNGYCYDMGEDCLHRQSQYNVCGSYSVANSQVPSYSQPNESSDNAGKERQLLGTIEEFDAFCKERKLKEALEALGLLEQNNISVDIPRYLFLMNECGESQALQEAKDVHDHLKRSVPCLDVYIYNKILETYLKCGSMEDAYELFDEMPQRNLTSWDTMITWMAKTGHGEDAIEMFTKFKRVGLIPDNKMFHSVFAACSVVGDMKEGLVHFESMRKKYNLVQSMDDYVSVVSMLGSSGYLNEAVEFIEKMPIKPNVEIWEIMMNQARVHGDLALGDHCAEIVNLLDPSRLNEQSKEGLIPIKPSDRAGDTSHPDHERVCIQLRCLKQPMIEAGYVPDTRFALYDIDHESKEETLLSHSETLSVSWALLTSPARAPIRIYNNVRTCGNCHNALKIISKLVGRQISAHDEGRFHCYKNGVCSCGDYW